MKFDLPNSSACGSISFAPTTLSEHLLLKPAGYLLTFKQLFENDHYQNISLWVKYPDFNLPVDIYFM